MWLGFSMQYPVFGANNPRENTDPSEFKIRIEFESPTPQKKEGLETHSTSGCLNISKDVLNAKCLIGVLIKNLGGL